MELNKRKILRMVIIGSSLLGITAYYVENDMFFYICTSLCTLLVLSIVAYSVKNESAGVKPISILYMLFFAQFFVIGFLIHKGPKGLLLGGAILGLVIVLLTDLFDYIHNRNLTLAPRWMHSFFSRHDYFDIKTIKLEDEPKEEMDSLENDGYMVEKTRGNITLYSPNNPEPNLLKDTDNPDELNKKMDMAMWLVGMLEEVRVDETDSEKTKNVILELLGEYVSSGLWKKDYEAIKTGYLAESDGESRRESIQRAESLHEALLKANLVGE